SAIQNEVEPITSILIDTQSQFWTLRFEPNPEIAENKRQLEELAKWNLKPNNLANTRVFVPPSSNKFLGDEIEFRIKPSDLTHSEWCALIGQEVYSPQGHIIAETLRALAGRAFTIDDLVSFISDDQNWPAIAESSRNAILYKLSDYQNTQLFSPDGISVA